MNDDRHDVEGGSEKAFTWGNASTLPLHAAAMTKRFKDDSLTPLSLVGDVLTQSYVNYPHRDSNSVLPSESLIYRDRGSTGPTGSPASAFIVDQSRGNDLREIPTAKKRKQTGFPSLPLPYLILYRLHGTTSSAGDVYV